MSTSNLPNISICESAQAITSMLADKVYRIFDCINKAGFDNSEWGLVEYVDTVNYFGSKEHENLNGKFVYIWVAPEDFEYQPELNAIVPDYVLHTDDESEIRLYEID